MTASEAYPREPSRKAAPPLADLRGVARFPLRLHWLAAVVLAFGPKFLARRAVQTLGIRLITARFGNRLLLVLTHRRLGGGVRQGGSDTDRKTQNCRTY